VRLRVSRTVRLHVENAPLCPRQTLVPAVEQW